MNTLLELKRPACQTPDADSAVCQIKVNVKNQMLQLDTLSQLMNQMDESESFSLDIAFFHGLSKFLKSMSEISAETLSWMNNLELSREA